MNWEHDSYCTSESGEELENWQNNMDEVSTECCARITKSVCCMISEVCNIPLHDGLGDVNNFIDDYEK